MSNPDTGDDPKPKRLSRDDSETLFNVLGETIGARTMLLVAKAEDGVPQVVIWSTTLPARSLDPDLARLIDDAILDVMDQSLNHNQEH